MPDVHIGADLKPAEYVVGFAFDWDGRVALRRTNRPDGQAGQLNGIGGRVEPGERPDDAMEREFWKGTGTRLTAWDRFVVMDFPGARIHFYRLVDLDPQLLNDLKTTTDEEVCRTWPGDANWHLMAPNLTWLIPLATCPADTYDPIEVSAAMSAPLGPAPLGPAAPAPPGPEQGARGEHAPGGEDPSEGRREQLAKRLVRDRLRYYGVTDDEIDDERLLEEPDHEALGCTLVQPGQWECFNEYDSPIHPHHDWAAEAAELVCWVLDHPEVAGALQAAG